MSDRVMVEEYKHYPGHHCETTAARNVFKHAGVDISEEMLFGLGEGLGFIYWFMKGKKVSMPFPFVGGRSGRVAEVVGRVSKRLGIGMRKVETKSEDVAYRNVKRHLMNKGPVCIYVDMVYLPYMRLPEEAHFGGHAITLYGLDEATGKAYVSDVLDEPQTMTLDELRKARSSRHQPCPPKNRHLEFTFPESLPDISELVLTAIRNTAVAMARPPISNLGLKGILKFAEEFRKWPRMLSAENLLRALVNTFIFIEIGGTGGASFRPMYSRFLKEARNLTGEDGLLQAAELYERSAQAFTSLGVALLPDELPAMARLRTLMLEKDRLLKREKLDDKNERLIAIESRFEEAIRQALSTEIPQYENHIDRVVEAIKRLHAAETEATSVLLKIRHGSEPRP